MAAKREINLLSTTEFQFTNVGKLISWAVNVGRWIVVLTEFIVICAFLSRFYFDTKLSNLFDETRQKKAIVSSSLAFEEQFRQTQEKAKLVKIAFSEAKTPSATFIQVASKVPLDVTLTSISYDTDSVNIEGYSLSENSIKIFLNGLGQIESLTSINISKLSSKAEGLPGTTFSIQAAVNNEPAKTPKEESR